MIMTGRKPMLMAKPKNATAWEPNFVIQSCYVYTNNVHAISRTNRYQIVIIDGYDIDQKSNATGQ